MNYQELFITESATLLEALAKLDKTALKILFVVDDEQRLLAALSDGDIRRHILRRGQLTDNVRAVANYHPNWMMASEKKSGLGRCRSLHIDALPILNENRKIIDVFFAGEKTPDLKKLENPPIVVMNAGGMGTRLYPYTKILPKPLIPIGEVPISEIIMERFHQLGCQEFYMIVNHKKNMIKAYFAESVRDYQVHFVDEDQPLDTGGGLSLLKGRIDRTMVFTNCDTIIDDDLEKVLALHAKNHNKITMICAMKNYVVPYGVVETGDDGEILAMKEKPSLSFLTNTGCYVIEPEVIERMTPNESVDFPTVIERERQRGTRVGIYPMSDYHWLDMGQFNTMEQMRERLGV